MLRTAFSHATGTGWHSQLPQDGTPPAIANGKASKSQESLLARLGRLGRGLPEEGDDTTGITKALQGTALDLDLETRKKILCAKIRAAISQAEWHYAAVELDDLEGNNEWKYELESTEYNYVLIKARLEELEDARISCDIERMLFLIRTSLSRHLGGTGNIRLYRRSHVGTKDLIRRYINSALDTIRTFLDTTHRQSEAQDARHLLEQVLAARQSFGRSALLMSGGGTFGMYHIGVIKCLWENNLLPRIITGASAGSIVCAVLCTRKDEEISALLEEFCYGDLEVFTKTGVDDGVLRQVTRFLKTGALFDVSNLTRVMRNLMGDITFQEAYNRTRRILNICVSSASVFELPRLLNYITAPNVIIWSAVAASCSVPGVFTAASLLAKDSKTGKTVPWNPSPQRWVDGSIEGDIPTTRIAEMFNVNHFIVSQVNPHVVPFLIQEEGPIAAASQTSEIASEAGPSWLSKISNLAKTEALHRMHVLSELGVLPNLLTKVSSLLSQRYSGDITILPQIPYSQFTDILKNPTTEYMLGALLSGERATWPQLDRIRNHCAIELALDGAVHELRARIAFPAGKTDTRVRSRTMSGGMAHTRLSKRPHEMAGSGGTPTVGLHELGLAPSVTRDRVAHPGEFFADTQKKRKSPMSLSLDTNEPRSGPRSGHVHYAGMNTSPGSISSDFASDSDGIRTRDYSSSSDELSPVAQSSSRTKQLFPHSSQPSTPAHHRMPRLGYFGSRSPLAYTSSSGIPSTRAAMSPSPSSTSIYTNVMQDARAGQDAVSTTRPSKYTRTNSSSAFAGVTQSNTMASRTRDKRSMSTGMKGLLPPNQR